MEGRGSREASLEAIAVFQASTSGCSDKESSSGKRENVADLECIFAGIMDRIC